MIAVRIFGTALLASLAALGQTPSCSLVPGWEQDGAVRRHTPENLYEYLDGGAEGYLIYRFVKLEGVNCKAGETNVVLDVFEMADPESAYGIFTSTRDQSVPVEKLGMVGQGTARRLTFSKDKYYVELGISADGLDTLRAFAVALEKKIPGSTELPAAIGWFPAGGAVKLVPESVLGMRALKRGYIAQYEYGQAFIVAEASPQTAAAVLKQLRGRVAGPAAVQLGDEAFQANDKYLGRLCFFRKGRYLAGFSGLAEGQDAAARGAELAARIP